MSPLLTVLNDLAWIIECAAMDHTGEAKSELGTLSKRLLADPAFDIADKKEISAVLSEAREAYVRGDRRVGSHLLMTISRTLEFGRLGSLAVFPRDTFGG